MLLNDIINCFELGTTFSYKVTNESSFLKINISFLYFSFLKFVKIQVKFYLNYKENSKELHTSKMIKLHDTRKFFSPLNKMFQILRLVVLHNIFSSLLLK